MCIYLSIIFITAVRLFRVIKFCWGGGMEGIEGLSLAKSLSLHLNYQIIRLKWYSFLSEGVILA